MCLPHTCDQPFPSRPHLTRMVVVANACSKHKYKTIRSKDIIRTDECENKEHCTPQKRNARPPNATGRSPRRCATRARSNVAIESNDPIHCHETKHQESRVRVCRRSNTICASSLLVRSRVLCSVVGILWLLLFSRFLIKLFLQPPIPKHNSVCVFSLFPSFLSPRLLYGCCNYKSVSFLLYGGSGSAPDRLRASQDCEYRRHSRRTCLCICVLSHQRSFGRVSARQGCGLSFRQSAFCSPVSRRARVAPLKTLIGRKSRQL